MVYRSDLEDLAQAVNKLPSRGRPRLKPESGIVPLFNKDQDLQPAAELLCITDGADARERDAQPMGGINVALGGAFFTHGTPGVDDNGTCGPSSLARPRCAFRLKAALYSYLRDQASLDALRLHRLGIGDLDDPGPHGGVLGRGDLAGIRNAMLQQKYSGVGPNLEENH